MYVTGPAIADAFAATDGSSPPSVARRSTAPVRRCRTSRCVAPSSPWTVGTHRRSSIDVILLSPGLDLVAGTDLRPGRAIVLVGEHTLDLTPNTGRVGVDLVIDPDPSF